MHSLSHSLGGVNPRLHHGTLNAMFLPAVVRFNAQAESVQKERRLERMAHAMGLASASDIPEAIRDMNARLGLPTGLAAMGVTPDVFDDVIKAPWPTTATRPTRALPRLSNTGKCCTRACKNVVPGGWPTCQPYNRCTTPCRAAAATGPAHQPVAGLPRGSQPGLAARGGVGPVVGEILAVGQLGVGQGLHPLRIGRQHHHRVERRGGFVAPAQRLVQPARNHLVLKVRVQHQACAPQGFRSAHGRL